MASKAPLQPERVRYQKKGWAAWNDGIMEVFEDMLTLKADMTAGEPEMIPFSSIISIMTREEKVPALFGRPFAISLGLSFWRILIDTNIGTHWELDVGLMRTADLVSNAYDQWKQMQTTTPEGGSSSHQAR